MRLISCYIENFGAFHHQTFSFEEGLNLYLEDNGWGKTTLAAFLKAMFYGLDYRVRSKELYERPRYQPWQGGPYGGEVIFETAQGRYRISRFWGRKASEDELLVTDCSTNKPSSRFTHGVGEELFGIDRDSFERSIFIRLPGKAPSMSDSIHSRLGSLLEDSGEGESYESALHSLEQASLRIRAKRGRGGLLGELEAKRLRLKEEILSCEDARRQASLLEEDLSSLDGQIQRLENHKTSLLERMEASSLTAGQSARRLLGEDIQDRKRQVADLHAFFRNDLPDEDRLEEMRGLYQQLLLVGRQLAQTKAAPMTTLSPSPSPFTPLILLGGMAVTLLGSLGLVAQKLLRNPASRFSLPARLMEAIYRLWPGISPGIFLGIFTILLVSGILLFLVGILTILSRKRTRSTCRRHASNWKDTHKKHGKGNENTEDREHQGLLITQEEIRGQIRDFLKLFPSLPRPETLKDIPKSISILQGRLYDLRRLEEELAVLEERFYRDFPPERDTPLCEDASPTRIRADLTSCDRELKQLVASMAEKKDLLNKAWTLADKKEGLAGELTSLEEHMRELETRHSRIQACIQYLKAAKDRLSTGYMPTMEASFQTYMSLLDSTDHHSIALDTDLSAYISQGGRLWKDGYLSTGYSDLVNICLRLALSDAMYDQERPFLIMDDPFVNLDASKLGRAKAFLRRLAQDRQILYFTCHESRA